MKNIKCIWEPRGNFGVEGVQLGDIGVAFEIANNRYKIVIGDGNSVGIDFNCSHKAFNKIFEILP